MFCGREVMRGDHGSTGLTSYSSEMNTHNSVFNVDHSNKLYYQVCTCESKLWTCTVQCVCVCMRGVMYFLFYAQCLISRGFDFLHTNE